MKAWRALKRFLRIIRIVGRYRLQENLPQRGFWRLLHLLPAQQEYSTLPYAQRLRLALEDLGPLFVKLGQTLSTRPDLLSEEWLAELSLLQDRVPPFSGKEALRIAETAWQSAWQRDFRFFDETPLASASVAQVHAAQLHSGEEVIVKILRPNIHQAVQQDLELMYSVAQCLQYTPEGKRLRPVEVVREFEQTLEYELDLMCEAANASQLRANFADSDLLYVPEIYWNWTRSNVMVMERIRAVNIADAEALAAANVNMKVLGERGVEIFFTQVFRDSFFHADMHPGNIFVDISNPEKPRYCAIDFGIMGSLTPEDQHYLAENFLAFFNRDYRRVAELHIESGWVPPETRVTDFEAAIRKVSEPIFGKPIKDISFGAFLLSLFQTARRFNMHIQPQLVLLQKTFFNVEGLGRRLYPELDLWTTAKPVLEDWMKTQIGMKAFLKRFRVHAHDYAKVIPQLPLLAAEMMRNQSEKKRHSERFYTGWACLLSAFALAYLQPPESASAGLALGFLAVLGWFLRRPSS